VQVINYLTSPVLHLPKILVPTLFSYHFCAIHKNEFVFCHTAFFIYEEAQMSALLKGHFVFCRPSPIFRVSLCRVENKAIPLSRHVLQYGSLKQKN
jgi:hypothetical protein